MSDLPENPRPDRDFRRSSLSSSSGDVSVDLELQIEGEDRHAVASSAIRESVSDSHTDTGSRFSFSGDGIFGLLASIQAISFLRFE